jgi:ATP-binding cassette subfamily F protein 3
MLGEYEPISGQVKLNPKIRISRFTQHHVDQLDLTKTPLSWFQDMYKEAKHQEIRKHLGLMGITGNLALQPIYSLSGSKVPQ